MTRKNSLKVLAIAMMCMVMLLTMTAVPEAKAAGGTITF